MQGQLSLSDVYGELLDQSEESIVQDIGKGTGLRFALCEIHNKYRHEECYKAKRGKVEFEICFNTYVDSSKMFIDVGYLTKKSSGGAPCDSVNKAIDYINKILLREATNGKD